MRFIVNNRELLLEIDSNDKLPNSGSIKDYLIDVEFSEEWDGLSKVAKICIDGENEGIERGVIDDKVYIDMNEHKNYAIGFIGYTLENNKKVFQKSTNLKVIPYFKGAGEIEVQDEDIPTPSQWEIYIAQIQEIANEASRSAEDAESSANIANQQAGIATSQAQEATRQAGISKSYAEESARQAQIASDEADRAEQARVGFEEEVQTATTNFNNNATQKTSDFNSNTTSKTNEYNTNATEKTNTFNTNASNKTTSFNNNATQKETDFNTNATEKTTTFNENATQKTDDFNSNANQKTTEFNQNAQEKLDEFNENAESYNNRITELESENKSLKAQLPTGTGTGEYITLNDSAGDINWKSIKPNGKTEQESTTGKQLLVPNVRTVSIAEVKADGSVAVSGTISSNTNVGVGTLTLDAGTYTFSPNGDAIPSSWYYFFTDAQGQALYFGGEKKTFTLETAIERKNLNLVMTSGTYSNLLLKPMITSGSTREDWEPYTRQDAFSKSKL